MATVGVLDDHRSFAEALCMAINATSDLECVGIAGTMEAAAQLARTLQPDVVILDYQLLDGDGLALARQLEADELPTRFLMLSAHASPDLRSRAMSAGVSGLLAKDAPLSEVLAAVRSLASDGMLEADPDGALLILTTRQREVLELLGQGFAPTAIGEQLFVSVHTVRGYVKELLRLLGASSQLEAVTIALQRGLLIPPRVQQPPEE